MTGPSVFPDTQVLTMAGFAVFPDSRVLKMTDDPNSHYFHILHTFFFHIIFTFCHILGPNYNPSLLNTIDLTTVDFGYSSFELKCLALSVRS